MFMDGRDQLETTCPVKFRPSLATATLCTSPGLDATNSSVRSRWFPAKHPEWLTLGCTWSTCCFPQQDAVLMYSIVPVADLWQISPPQHYQTVAQIFGYFLHDLLCSWCLVSVSPHFQCPHRGFHLFQCLQQTKIHKRRKHLVACKDLKAPWLSTLGNAVLPSLHTVLWHHRHTASVLDQHRSVGWDITAFPWGGVSVG